MNRLFRERVRYLCRQLELAERIGPRTERALIETTDAIDAPRTLARRRMGEEVVVFKNGAVLRRCQVRESWVYALDGAETPL